jgi:hypothetical protein
MAGGGDERLPHISLPGSLPGWNSPLAAREEEEAKTFPCNRERHW